jgi:glycosyltransferase involved in cell wall biosynthesis
MALHALSRFGQVRDYFVTVHGTEVPRYRNESFPRLWMKGAFRRVSAVAAVSHAVRDLLVANFPEAADRTFVAHPGISQTWLDTPVADRAAVRRQWGIHDDDVAVLTVSRRVPEKGHDRVLAGLGALPEALRARAPYVVVGAGPSAYAEQLERSAQAEGVRLILTGSLPEPDVIAACDSADVFAMLSRATPKRVEGFGLAYLEASARGLPCLACATGGVAEAVKADVTGILLPADADTAAVAAALHRLVEHKDSRKRLGAEGRIHAGGFTQDRFASETYEQAMRLGTKP